MKPTAYRALFMASALLLSCSAWAIDFEDMSANLNVYATGDSFTSGGYTFTTFNSDDSFDFVGALVTGTQADSCSAGLSCPTGDSTTYYAGLNDGGVAITSSSNGVFTVSSFDAGYIGASQSTSTGGVARIELTGFSIATNSYITAVFDLGGTSAAGNYSFSTFSLANTAFAGTVLSSLSVNACYVTTDGSCTWPANDLAQFAIDNIAVQAVPEPETWQALLAGLVVVLRCASKARSARKESDVLA